MSLLNSHLNPHVPKSHVLWFYPDFPEMRKSFLVLPSLCEIITYGTKFLIRTLNIRTKICEN